MPVPINSLAVANYFICKSFEEGKTITLMKVIKLVYISHGWYLGITDNPLLPEGVQAWQYGPVVPSVYQAFRHFGRKSITEMAFDTGTNAYPLPEDPEIQQFLDKIWDVYGSHDGLELSALTHQKGTPWYKTKHGSGGKADRTVLIRNDLIKKHYQDKIVAPSANAD
jgi:uncharacterized phage-associated protein